MSGGQNVAHCPAQALLPFLSFPNRYSVCPRELTRIRPRPVCAVLTTVRAVAGAALLAAGRSKRNASTASIPSAAAVATNHGLVTAARAPWVRPLLGTVSSLVYWLTCLA